MSGSAWRCRDRTLPLDRRSLVMGVVNVTPDSFSDGGRLSDADAAVAYALKLVAEGADILDIGGESSRPGATPVSAEEELARVIPVISGLSGRTNAMIAVDTTKASVAKAAVQAGASIINDISAATLDPLMLNVMAEAGAGIVLMHMRGQPATMQQQPAYVDVVAEVAAYLSARVDAALHAGIARNSIIVDPGIGFGKTVAHNLALLSGIPVIAAIAPVLVGVSRKSFLGALTGLPVEQRLIPSLAAMSYAVLQGARIVRVHDVKQSCEALRVLDSLRAPDACNG